MNPSLTDDQLDEVLDALADTVTFSVDDLAALRLRTIAAVDPITPTPAGTWPAVVLPGRPSPSRSRRRALATLVAAAVLVGVAVLTFGIVQTHRPAGTGPAADGAEVTCLADPGSPTPGATDRAKALIAARLAALGAPGAGAPGSGVTSTGVVTDGAGRLLVSADGIGHDELATVCASTRPALRPLLSAPFSPRPGDCTAPLTDAPLDQALVACDRSTPATSAYRLGPAVVGPADITDATAEVQPGAPSSWVVSVTFAPAASERLFDYTTRHHTDSSSTCGSPSAPCSDFLAIVVGGTVALAPVIQTPISMSLQISGKLDQSSATLLAAQLAAGDLELVEG